MQFSDILVKNALFCDETEDYRTPAEPEAGDSVVIGHWPITWTMSI